MEKKVKREARLMLRDACLLSCSYSSYKLATEALSNLVIKVKMKIIVSSISCSDLMDGLGSMMVKNTGLSPGW